MIVGQSRTVTIQLDPESLLSHRLTTVEVTRAVEGANAAQPAGSFTRGDELIRVETRGGLATAEALSDLVVGVFDNRPVFLKDVASVSDGAEEVIPLPRSPRGTPRRFRHGWGPSHTSYESSFPRQPR